METAKDILYKNCRASWSLVGPSEESMLKAMQEIANKVHSYAKAKYNDNCECEICQMDYPTFMKSLFPETK